MKSIQYSLSILLSITFLSCGGYDDNDSNYNAPNPTEEQSQEGTFRGVANAINSDVVSANAAIQIRIDNDQFDVEIFGSGPATTHGQYIHAGTRCPTSADDTNQDGVIDTTEGTAVYGARVLPLDSDLATNGGAFPNAANYNYNQSASFSQMLANLNIPSLNVEGKVVTIQGVPETTTLPATAQGAKADFPIACGTLLRTP